MEMSKGEMFFVSIYTEMQLKINNDVSFALKEKKD